MWAENIWVNTELATTLYAVLLRGQDEGRELTIGLFVSHPYGIKIKLNFIR